MDKSKHERVTAARNFNKLKAQATNLDLKSRKLLAGRFSPTSSARFFDF
jgi:hypothetical protein